MAYSHNMIHGKEVAGESFSKAAGLFQDLKHHLSITGVISGVVPGRIFLSNDDATALLTSPQGIFLGGRPDNILFFEEANKLLANELLPNLASGGQLDYVLFYPSDDYDWRHTLDLVMKDLLPLRSGRLTFSHDLNNINTVLYDHIVPINSQLLKQHNIAGLDELLCEIQGNWPSMKAFEDRGFGCVAIQHTDAGPTIISWCLTDWVVGNECELGIQTDEKYRGNGWARKTVLGALSLAKKRGITKVGWQCWSSNIGSQRTATSAGFKLVADSPVLFGWNLPLNNLLVNGNHYMRGDLKYGVNKDYSRAAWSYAQALDKGWDWNGDAALYWNTACMFYLIDEQERAKHYYKAALEKGWTDFRSPHYHEYVYREENSEQIARALAELANK